MSHPVGPFLRLPDRGEEDTRFDDSDGFVTQSEYEYLAAQRWLRMHLNISTGDEDENYGIE